MGRLVNETFLLFVIVDVTANTDAPHSDLPGDADAAIRRLYSDHAEALFSYVLLAETFYHGGTTTTTAVLARRLGIPHGTARSRLHYALHALRAHLQDQCPAACP